MSIMWKRINNVYYVLKRAQNSTVGRYKNMVKNDQIFLELYSRIPWVGNLELSYFPPLCFLLVFSRSLDNMEWVIKINSHIHPSLIAQCLTCNYAPEELFYWFVLHRKLHMKSLFRFPVKNKFWPGKKNLHF